jgi:hypothetical protein
MRLNGAYRRSNWTASLNAKVRLGRLSLSPTRGWATRSGSSKDGQGHTRLAWAAPAPSPARTGASDTLSQPFEGDGRRGRPRF